MYRKNVTILVVFAGILAAPTGLAQPKDNAARSTAQALGEAGVEAYEAGDYIVAGDKLQKAYDLLPAATIGLWCARALAKQGKLLEAAEHYRDVTRLKITSGQVAKQTKAQADAAAELPGIESKIPTLTAKFDGPVGPGVAVNLDGTPLALDQLGHPQRLNPGHHRIDAELNGEKTTGEVDLAEREQHVVVLAFAPRPAPAPVAAPSDSAPPPPPDQQSAPPGPTPQERMAEEQRRQDQLRQQQEQAAAQERERRREEQQAAARLPYRIAGYIGIGAGGIGLAVGTIAAISAANKKNDLGSYCVGTQCADTAQASTGSVVGDSAARSTLDSARSSAVLSTWSTVAGLTLAAAGVTLLVIGNTIQAEPEGTAVAVRMAPGGVAVHGTF